METYSNVIDIQQEKLDANTLAECSAYKTNADGSVQEFECEVTLNKIIYQDNDAVRSCSDESISTFYVLTASTDIKTSTHEESAYGITLKGSIGWVDNLGVNNLFKYTSGSRSGNYSGDGWMALYAGQHALCDGYFSGSTFYKTSDKDDQYGLSFRLLVKSKTPNGEEAMLEVKTSIFD